MDEIPKDIPLEDFISQAIYSIYRITFTEPKKGYLYLEDLSKSLSQENEISSLKLNEKLLDRILMEIICLSSSPTPNSFLYYPVSCYKRLNIMMKKENQNKERYEALKRLSTLTLSYLTLAMQNIMLIPSLLEDLTMNNSNLVSDFVDIISLEEDEDFSPSQFVNDIVNTLVNLYGIESITEIFDPIVEDLRIRTLQAREIPLSFYRALYVLIKNDTLKEMIVEFENWIPKDRFNGKEIEARSILGPFFRLEYHSLHNLEKHTSPEVRKKLQTQIKLLYEVVIELLEYEKTRNQMKLWIFETLYRNRKRNAINVDRATISNDTFMMNLNKVLLHILITYLKINEDNICKKIRIKDVISQKKLFEESMTRIFAESEQLNEYFKSNPVNSSQSNQYSLDSNEVLAELFSYTLTSFELGGNRGLIREKLELVSASSSYGVVSQVQFQKFASESLDSDWIKNICTLLRALSKWIIFSATNKESFDTLPLDNPSIEYQLLPQFIFENISELLSLIPPHNLFPPTESNDIFIKFLIAILYTPNYIKNPYLKGKYSEVIAVWCTEKLDYINEYLSENIFELPFVVKYLGPTLFKFYMNEDLKNLPTQFLERYQEREFVFVIFNYIWNLPQHREVILKYLEDENELLSFFDCIISDILNLIDGYLSLNENYRTNAPRSDEYNNMRESIKTQKRLLMNSAEFIYLFIKDSTRIFLRKELLEKIASMINYCISRIYKQTFKRYEDEKDKKYFYSKFLRMLMYIYKEDKGFVDYILNDEKSTFDIFQPLLEFAKQDNTLLEDFSIESLEKMIEDINEKKLKKKALEEKIGEIPEEFIDPLIGTIMRDPVKLPTSNIIVDRITIEKHLSTDKTDPFNRQPLESKDLIPQQELKKKIDMFLESKMKIEEEET